MSEVPLYLDWKFWSAVVAAIALVLSQLPPLHIVFKKAKLTCEAYSRLHLTHKVGNPNSQWHLIIENTGGRAVRVKEINLQFRRIGSEAFELPAQSYLKVPGDSEPVMFTPFRLKPGEEWAHIINFFNIFNRDDEKEYRWLESEIRSDILAQREKPENKDKLCEANKLSVRKATAFFTQQFKWHAGEYELQLVVVTDRNLANFSHNYRFSLFESESKELADYVDQYKYGAGIYWVSAAQPGLLSE